MFHHETYLIQLKDLINTTTIMKKTTLIIDKEEDDYPEPGETTIIDITILLSS